MARKVKDVRERFDAKWTPVDGGRDTPCWRWTASLKDTGYGQFSRGRLGEGMELAHRMAYMLYVGPIPVDMELDHMCRNRWCVNPAHLEPVTKRVNVLRGIGPTAANASRMRCREGHALAGSNVLIYRDGKRRCRECNRAWQRARRKRATS